MPIMTNALFTDVDEVWDYLCVHEEDRLVKNSVMERWINMASAFMETLLNRPCLPRDVHEQLDGNGGRVIYVRQTPALSLLSLRIWDSSFQNFEDVNVDQTNDAEKEVSFEATRGRLVLLRQSPRSHFTPGASNIEINYRAGWTLGDLAVIQEAALELIAVRYNEIGRNPREQTRSDSIVTTSAFTKGDFDELPWMTKQTVMHYRKRSF